MDARSKKNDNKEREVLGEGTSSSLPKPAATAAAPAPNAASPQEEVVPAQPAAAAAPQQQQVAAAAASHNVSQATYPLPEPLVQRLRAGVLLGGDDDSSSSANGRRNDAHVETFESALSELVANSLEAIDGMYFTTPAPLRQHVEHRLCLRVRADVDARTLSVTDLGTGLTRSDLINSLGIGKGLLLLDRSSSRNNNNRGGGGDHDSRDTDSTDDEEETTDDDDEEDSESDEDDADTEDDIFARNEAGTTEDDSDEEEGKDATATAAAATQKQPATAPSAPAPPVSCRTADLGGFYAALCSLGTAVRVGTKSKHDDYYEFHVGDVVVTPAESEAAPSPLETFSIRRPNPEGTALTVENGFGAFEQVRGESGTCVTLRLNDAAVKAGLLDEQNVLKPIFLKIVETTQHSVAFSSDAEGARELVQADAGEAAVVAQALAEQQADVSLEAGVVGLADMELASRAQHDNKGAVGVGSHTSVLERSKYIPLRLSLDERKMLRLVEACMTCCDYTTRVDRQFQTQARRVHEQLKNITSVLRGLVTACDYQAGQSLLEDDNFLHYEKFFRQMFEIARRHKIMNPEKMRTEYGKLCYLLQDAASGVVQRELGFSVVGPIHSVYKFLEERGGLALLSDQHIETATEEILAGKKSRSKIETEIRLKERAVSGLKRRHQSRRLSAEDIHLCLYSICDNNSFLNSNRVPIDKIIDYLTSHFSPHRIEEGFSLSIVSGEDGARLSHNHERQYYFALQSLTLWRDIIDDMFRLWAMAEADLLSESVTYSLQDTGQGMQRVQQSPRTYRAMQQILVRVQKKVSHWVGSSVIHLGEHNVPNALSFIDKYTQVPRILGPIVACLENLERVCEKDVSIQAMIDDGFGGLEKLRKDILFDFFRSAFDGSGADNFYDAGSCIDGRLTSAWNWCSQLPDKPFYPIFKLTGFIGFDGEFK